MLCLLLPIQFADSWTSFIFQIVFLFFLRFWSEFCFHDYRKEVTVESGLYWTGMSWRKTGRKIFRKLMSSLCIGLWRGDAVVNISMKKVDNTGNKI